MWEFILLIFLLGLFKLSAGTPSSLLDNRTNNKEFEISNATKFLSDPYFWLPISIIVLLVLVWGLFRKEEFVDWGENVYNGGGYPPNNYANSGAYAFGDFDFRPRIYTSVLTAFPGRGLYTHDLDTA
ncbi:Protein CBG14000 [Caenorhabditis briggsae]|uniref:Uncharacterized protein n=2 Tax=Caenorhabditis briggsae TaxID=6238 RepID=A0AAE8ZRB6_CAEBR|nr:Protein CBG14000 [Caenorhabditis briggsae]ULT81497.1 hypothetical protein L3Y34_011440 [Caenorhabditis briggsae]UMM40816.1 hypothetical protein L5515_017327 [Caenorhabditis briggsae]CAP32690.2 Protein CBG14000 [Caenorhabditis briggsae]